MKALSIIVTLQGLAYFTQSIIRLFRDDELEIGIQLVNSNYNIVGIILGTWLIVTGIGIWYRKRYAYISTIVVYAMLSAYIIASVAYILATQPINSDVIIPIALAAILLILFLIVIRYVKKNKLEFR